MRAVLLLLLPFLMRADPGDDCFRFYYGPGKDLVRARVCFEALMPSQPCAGSSPELPRLYLGAMYVDGQGGPVNRPAAEALFIGCFRDSSVEALLKKKPAGNLDFCHDVGGSTLAELQCNAMAGTLRSAELEEAKRAVRAGLRERGMERFCNG